MRAFLENWREPGWRSKKSKMMSKKLRGKPEALKQNSWDAVRVYWAPVFSRGQLHIEMLGEGFPREAPAGAAMLVAKARGSSKPHRDRSRKGLDAFSTNFHMCAVQSRGSSRPPRDRSPKGLDAF